MTDLSTRESLRVEQVLGIWLSIIEGQSLTDALAEADVSKATYYRWLPKAKEAKEILDQAKQTVELISYADILATKNRILAQLLTDALAPITEPKDRLAILSYLDGRTDLLRERNRPESETPDFLDGPILTEAESRVLGGGVFDVTIQKDQITIKTNPQDVIDITPEDQNGISSGSS